VPTFDARRIAIIGFGEVGGIFARDLIASGRYDVAAYDILLDDATSAPRLRDKARALRVIACASAAEAASGVPVVISAVTAASALAVAEAAARYLKPGQLFLDVNSVSPDTKRAAARAVERSGAHYVEAAVMAAVAPYGLKVPILLGGRQASAIRDLLTPAGMVLEVAAAEIGKASATKMSRSIMMKGLEALMVECLYTARHYGVENAVLTSLAKTYPGMDWEKLGGYWLGRVIEHGRRRAAEMRESAATVAETGLAPLMAVAIAGRQDWLADRAEEQPALKSAKDEDWRATLDAIKDATGGTHAASQDG
jgi:3-hydroxyisobutyrate dehydrogenase-like beta-hydroxyacid dehydrogenase